MLIEQKLIKRIKKKQNKEAANASHIITKKSMHMYTDKREMKNLQKITMFDHDLFLCIDHPISVKTTFNII